MTKQEIEDKYFREYLLWCIEVPKDSSTHDLIFWIDHRSPCIDYFWEWFLLYKHGELR